MTELILTVILIVTGLIGMPIINFFKLQLGLSGNAALALTTGISVVLGAVVTFLGGAFGGLDWSLPSIVQAFTIVFTAATLFYKAMTTGKREDAAKPDAE